MFVAPLAAQNNSPVTISERLLAAEGAFEIGAYQSLRAIETFLQTQYRYGIGRGTGMFLGFTNRDLVNPKPEARAPDTFKNTIAKLSDNLEIARATLAQTNTSKAIPFILDLQDLWFDVNANNELEEGEGAVSIMGQILTRRRGNDNLPKGSIEIRFDGADHAWLMAYTHAISAVAEAILAFDPTPVFADLLEAEASLSNIPTIEYTFNIEELRERLALLNGKLTKAKKTVEELKTRRRPLEEKRKKILLQVREAEFDKSEKEALKVEARDILEQLNRPEYDTGPLSQNVRFLNQEIRSIEAKIPTKVGELKAEKQALNLSQRSFGDTRNSIYAFFKILQQPPNKTHVANVERNLRAMFSQNQLFWEKVLLETDNDREWVPNPSQTSAIGVKIDGELASVWQTILDDALAVLDGRLLVPHPLLPSDTGINLASWFDNPSSLDVIGWLHGRAAYPYLAHGPSITRENWFALRRLTQGNAFAFSIYLN